MPANNKILICAVLTTGLLLQGSSCFGDDRTKLSSTWKLVAFMTEDINNKVQENVCDKQAEGYLTFTAAGRVFGFATTKGGEPLASTRESYDASRPIISYSGNYRVEGNDLAAKVDLVWEEYTPENKPKGRNPVKYRLARGVVHLRPQEGISTGAPEESRISPT